MGDKTQDYNLAVIRQLLLAAFTAKTLRRFCQDRPIFQHIVNEFGPDHGFSDMIDKVIDYCHLHVLLDELLSEVKTENPGQYARFESALSISASVLAEIPCPYRGLEPFEAKHAKFYFGREAMVQRLVTKVAERPFVTVVGPSGCGKSSLVRAGLITALHGGAAPGRGRSWAPHVLRPSTDPLRALSMPLITFLEPEASEVVRMVEAQRLTSYLRERKLSMADFATRVQEKWSDPPHAVLVVDQFEELYTECRDEALRQDFVETLLAAAQAGISVVLALRADFFGHILTTRQLGLAVDAGLVNVLPMSEEELVAAIEQPALLTGRCFESGLVSRIVKDVIGEPGNLPLLEFALTELWAQQTMEGMLTHTAYEAIGRVEGAITRRAEAVFAELSEQGWEATVRRIFVRLTRYGEGSEGTRRRTILEDLVTPRTPHVDVVSIVDTLVDARLVVTGRDEISDAPVVEAAHEALIRGWARLKDWLDDDRTFGLWRERLLTAQQIWRETEQDEGALLRGVLLAEAQGWISERGDDLNEAERAFIDKSLAVWKEEEQRRQELEIAWQEYQELKWERRQISPLAVQEEQRQRGAELAQEQDHELDRLRKMVGARSALAWMGMASSVWRHTIDKHALTIRELAQLLNYEWQSLPNLPKDAKIPERIATIERLATQILQKPIMPPLSQEEGLGLVSLNAMVSERVRQLWEHVPYQVTELHLDLRLPDHVAVQVSAEWLRRAFDILVDNAVEAVMDRQLKEITVGTRSAGIAAEILVSDTGAGIPKDIRAKLFVEPIEAGARGIGMGLLMAQAILQTYGGEICVESTGPAGTTMVIWLPVA